jgi:hypothetical protein
MGQFGWEFTATGDGVRRVLQGMRRLRIPVLGYGGHDLPVHPYTATLVVSGDVVDDDPEVRRQRSRAAACARPEAKSNRLDLGQVAERDGEAEPALAPGGQYQPGASQSFPGDFRLLFLHR